MKFSELETKGATIGKAFIDAALVERIKKKMKPILSNRSKPVARTNITAFPEVSEVLDTDQVSTVLHTILDQPIEVAKVLLFDKTPDQNWALPWHQDTSIPTRVGDPLDDGAEIFMKDGVPHREAHSDELQRMLTLRLHLDDADENNGALRILPGSHQVGRLRQSQIQELFKTGTPHTCTVESGDLFMMRPLLVHQSHKSTVSARRRILHIELRPEQGVSRSRYIP